MKLLRFFILAASLSILYSCRKDKPVILEPIVSEEIQDVADQVFLSTTVKMRNYLYAQEYIKGCGFPGPRSEYTWQVDFRLDNEVSLDGSIFYPIARKWFVSCLSTYFYEDAMADTLEKWTRIVDWHETGMFYRYDCAQKKSFRYNGIDDRNPMLLMDFNLSAGEQFLIDSAYGINFVITSVRCIESSGQSYPVYLGKFIFDHPFFNWYYQDKGILTEVSPFNPNPYYMMGNFRPVQYLEWAEFQTDEMQTQPENWISENAMWSSYEVNQGMGISWGLDSTINLVTHCASYNP